MGEAKYKKVLLIDDNEMDNIISRKLIELSSFAEKIHTVSSAKAGLDFLHMCKTEEELPNLIFLDILMPVMDGFGFLDEFEKLSELTKTKCRIIMLSTSESFKDLNRANKNRYVFKFLNKPLSEALLAAINV